MPYDKQEFRRCLRYEFKLGHTAALARRNLVKVFGDEIPSQRQCERWFKKFSSGDFGLEDEKHSGRPVKLQADSLIDVVRSNPTMSTREMASKLECKQSTVVRRLKKLGYVQKSGSWLPSDTVVLPKEISKPVYIELS